MVSKWVYVVFAKKHKRMARVHSKMLTVGIVLVVVLVGLVVLGLICKVMAVKIYEPPREEKWTGIIIEGDD